VLRATLVLCLLSDDKQDKDSNAELLQRIAQLEKQLKQATKGSSAKKASSKETGGRNTAGRGESASAEGENSRANPETHLCYICRELGHWRKGCPKQKSKSKEEAKVQPVLSVSANMSPTKIYVTAEINGEPVRCLLDSSCERSVIVADLAPNAKLTLSQYLCLVSRSTGSICSDGPSLSEQITLRSNIS